MFKALKDFPLSRDGIRAESITAGQPVDVPAALVAGLLAEGYITAVEPELEAPADAPLETAVEPELEAPEVDETETKPRRGRQPNTAK